MRPRGVELGSHRRVVIEGVSPEIDGGRFPAKAVTGKTLTVEADVFADGHDRIACVLMYRPSGSAEWVESPMEPLINDHWLGSFTPDSLGTWTFTIEGWVDHFATWLADLRKRVDAGQAVSVELLVGAEMAERASARAKGRDAAALQAFAEQLSLPDPDPAVAFDDDLTRLMLKYPDRSNATRYERELTVVVDPPLAGFSAWYELFPRSWEPGTLRGLEQHLDYVADMGFDVLYLPPIHPIGTTNRKGANNAEKSEPGEPGSPWAIGGKEGGHTAVHPELGDLDDLEHLVKAARARGLELALDLAFQCSPDHPWVKEHPEWFKHRPDGTIRYAENPPKRYQDIYPLDFESSDAAGLWEELASVTEFWVEHGVKVFRVDNPHTKPFPFWEWLIARVKAKHPDVIFLSEAFTRPRVMEQLAKLGFSQSYTYFAWRNTRWELETYFNELTRTDMRHYFRPNVWPNTPDILTEYLQHGGRPAFMIRLVLAATLSATYGIYGPAFELCENEPLRVGGEEYLHSEKYEVRKWDLDSPTSLRDLIARVNEIRRDNPALHTNETLQFCDTGSDHIVGYTKTSPDGSNAIVVAVNLDPRNPHSGMFDMPLEDLGLPPDRPYQVEDLLTGAVYTWQGWRNYVELSPHGSFAHILRIRG